MSTKQLRLEIPFVFRAESGSIVVMVAENDDPERIGYGLIGGQAAVKAARGFPVCRAIIQYPAEGWDAVFGWTQLVRSSDASKEFEMDQLPIYANVATPFAWYGVKPQMFDAPSRGTRYEIEWEAHCFLCAAVDAVLTPQIAAIAGFRWGFVATESDMAFTTPQALDSVGWNQHLPFLRKSYPAWSFEEDFAW